MVKIAKKNLSALLLLGLVVCATALRIVLISHNWPGTNSDEATMDLMALHIAYHGEHPIFFYGQGYMGSIQAYVGALLFHIFGVSLFSVRLGLVLMYALFLIGMYYLTSLLYTRLFALFVVGLLVFGSSDLLTMQVFANGGYAETRVFGIFIALMAFWLAYTSGPLGQEGEDGRGQAQPLRRGLLEQEGEDGRGQAQPLRRGLLGQEGEDGRGQAQPLRRGLLGQEGEDGRGQAQPLRRGLLEQGGEDGRGQAQPLRRSLLYGLLGLCTGLAMWSDLLILPCALTSGLLLWLYCRREVLSRAGLLLLIGFFVGFMPTILYNLSVPANYDSLHALVGTTQYSASRNGVTLFQQVLQAFVITLPRATGVHPACYMLEPMHYARSIADLYPGSSSNPMQCFVIEGSWGLGATVLWGIAFIVVVLPLWRCRAGIVEVVQTSGVKHRAFRGRYLEEDVSRRGGGLPPPKVSGTRRRAGTSERLIPCGRPRPYEEICKSDVVAEQPLEVTPVAQEVCRGYILQSARSALLISAALSFLLYMFSFYAAVDPRSTSRYLICLFFALPVVLWPLWYGISKAMGIRTRLMERHSWVRLVGVFIRLGLLISIFVTFIVGTLNIWSEVPIRQAAYDSQAQLTQELLNLGVTRIYSDYWTCARLTFQSQERLICAALDEHLQTGQDRYMPYRDIVRADPHPGYVFQMASSQAHLLPHTLGSHYQHYLFGNYVLYVYRD